MAVEAKRGCGYRKVNGLYLVGGGLSAPCDRMPFPLERCKVCGGGIKFTRGPQWLLPSFFEPHVLQEERVFHTYRETDRCLDESPCPVCNKPPLGEEFGPHLLLWIGRKHYTPEAYLEEGRKLGVSRRLSALPKGLVLGQTWVLLAHLDAVPAKDPQKCTVCNMSDKLHVPGAPADVCSSFQAPKPTPGIFCAFVPRAVELILKESDATPERREKEEKRGVTVVTVPDDDKDHQGSVWDKDEEDSQPELPGVTT